ncbi:unnamed protein product [Lampetra planeri]
MGDCTRAESASINGLGAEQRKRECNGESRARKVERSADRRRGDTQGQHEATSGRHGETPGGHRGDTGDTETKATAKAQGGIVKTPEAPGDIREEYGDARTTVEIAKQATRRYEKTPETTGETRRHVGSRGRHVESRGRHVESRGRHVESPVKRSARLTPE